MEKVIIASRLSEEAKAKLKAQNVKILDFGENTSLNSKIAFHADMSFLVLDSKNILIANEMQYKKSILSDLGLNVFTLNHRLGNIYPMDSPLNCVILEHYIICNIDTVSPFVLQYFKDSKTIINVRQGYTKCSCVIVSNNAIITEDAGIYNACKGKVDVLLVSKGHVHLTGYDYGFLGGASGKIGNIIAFNGDISLHPDFDKIKDFLAKYNKKALSLCSEELYDIGSILEVI